MRMLRLIAAVLLCVVLLSAPACMGESTVSIKEDGFFRNGVKLPSPPPTSDERENRLIWPRAAARKENQGYAVYPLKRRFLNLSVQDWNQDGREDLLYLRKSADRFVISPYLAEPDGSFVSAGAYEIMVPESTVEIAPLLTDLDADGKNDLLLVLKYPAKRLVPADRVRYIIYWGMEGGFDWKNPWSKESDLPPSPEYLVRDLQRRPALVLAQDTLAMPTKKALTRLLLKKTVLYRIRLVSLQARSAHIEKAIDFRRAVEERAEFLGDLQGWTAVVFPLVYHWEDKEKSHPVITYDWNADGTPDRIEILPGEKHVVTDGITGKVLEEFTLTRNNLLTGNFADLDGGHRLKEISLQPLQKNSSDYQTEMKIFSIFEKSKPVEVRIFEGLVFFPQCFGDYDGDGDLDILAVRPPAKMRDVLRQVLEFAYRQKSHADVLIYERTPHGYSSTPAGKRKIVFSGDVTGISSIRDLL